MVIAIIKISREYSSLGVRQDLELSPERHAHVPQPLETEDDPVFVFAVENSPVTGAVGAQVLLVLQDDGLSGLKLRIRPF